MADITGDGNTNTLNGTADADTIRGLAGNDTLKGLAGDDVLIGGVGDDTLNGGQGSDTYQIGPGHGFDIFGDTGTTGFDRIVAVANTIFIGLKSGFGPASGIEEISADAHADVTIHGGTTADVLNFSQTILTGIVAIDGGAGNDTITGSAAADTILGGAGNDTLNGGLGADTLDGGNGSDTLNGGAGKDELIGGAGNDTLTGGAGDDLLVGGNGADTLDGSEGSDTYRIDPADSGFDSITDTGTTGFDQIVLMPNAGGLGFKSGFGPANGIEEISGDGNAVISGSTSNDALNFSQTMLSGIRKIDGGTGNDTITGSIGADVILGGGGADTLKGGGGADVLDGGDGNDILTGGANADTFVIGPTAAVTRAERITDFVHGVDTIKIDAAGISSFADVQTHAAQVGANTVITFSAGNTLTLNNVALSTLTAADFDLGLDLATLTPAQGFRIFGTDAGDQSGKSVSSAGDINGDGFDDFIVGAPASAGTGNAEPFAGETYVIFGKSAGFADIDLAALTAAQGFRIVGADASDSAGYSVSSAGDFNGDGFDDLIIGAGAGNAAGNEKLYAGESYVIFGKSSGFADIDLAALTATQGFRIFGADEWDQSGVSVSSAGDVNGDGLDDVIIGASEADAAGNAKNYAGESYVIFGRGMNLSDIDLATLTAAQGFRIFGADAGDKSGFSVSSAGDVNGDGLDDVIIGAVMADAYGNAKLSAGESYVVFGKAAGLTDIDLAALTTSEGFRILGADADDLSGHSVSSAGDFNGDGFDDIIVGAIVGDADDNDKPNAGESYVIFGKSAGFADVDLSTLTLAQGFRIFGADSGDISGISVSSAGDVNGDGYDDLIVGALQGDAAGNGKIDAGESYVIFGKSTGLANLDLATLTANQGFRILGADASDWSGSSVSSAGDVNGDGFDDLLIGAPFADAAGNAKSAAGESYVLFGGNFLGAPIIVGTPGNDTLTGTAAAESFVGGRGTDTLIGNSGADSFRGGQGTDTIVVGNVMPLNVDGGAGVDTANLDALGRTIDLSGLNRSRFTDIEKIDLTGSAANTLILDRLTVLDLPGSNGTALGVNRMEITGDAADAVVLADGWTQFPTSPRSPFLGYSNGAARLLIESDVRVYSGEIDLAILPVAQGFHIFGVDPNDVSGWSVSSAGDINGDGFVDVIVGAPRAGALGNTKSFAGESYVIFGKASGFADIDLATLTPNQGFRIFGANANDMSGNSVSSAGDFNGDGFDDLIIGAYRANTGSGATYLILGKASGFADITPPTLTGGGYSGFLGSSVSSAGDVNGDGFDDLIIGAPYARDEAGEAYVILGKGPGGAGGTFRIIGADIGDRLGASVSSAGDLNGDGFDDIVVAAPFADAAENAKVNAGETYVIFGKASGFADIDLAAFSPAQGFVIWGRDSNPGPYYAGQSVSSAGDVNGDGFDDLIIGARFADNYGTARSGETYVIFGKAGFTNIDLATLAPTDGFTVYAQEYGMYTGVSVSSAGDVNGDGFDDLLIGTQNTVDVDLSGESYVIFGKASGFADIDLGALTFGQGIRILGADKYDGSGYSVSSAGDMNGDGFDDLIIGAPGASAAGNAKLYAGESYVLFGGDFLGTVVFAGTSGNDTLTGTAAAEIFVGGQADDALTGGGGADAFQAGEGDDTITVADLAFARVDGGTGNDKLVLLSAGASFDFRSLADNKTQSIEAIDFSGSGNNTLTLGLTDVLNMPDGRNLDFTGISSVPKSLVVDGNAGDTVNLDGDSRGTWTLAASDVNLDGSAGGAYDFWVFDAGAQDFAALAVRSDVGVFLI